ncbi:amidohydrolase family protein [Arthrobacter sp. NPDC093128]|uniref:amidohydrolase family protein n=1 Tax=Arthrobacter sp. NPDC093128 TaxID=3154979 RepID=UPI00342AF90A
MSRIDRIDVHQHIVPPLWAQALADRNMTSGGWETPAWGGSHAIAMMDRQGIATGILSVTSPGTVLGGGKEGAGLARAVNEFAAELQRMHPDRIGSFASLPLPDVDAAIAEAIYSLDVLHADGVVVMSNVGGKYLGDPDYEPLWAELDRRGATVFVHPAQPPMTLLEGTPAPMADYVFDTTRTALNMVLNGVMGRYTNMKVILSHGGGFLPFAAYRFSGLKTMLDPSASPESVMVDLKRFYFDTALAASPSALPSLLAFAEPGHVLYGSDWPFANETAGTYFNGFLEEYEGFTDGQAFAIERGSAEVLFPRLARASDGPKR